MRKNIQVKTKLYIVYIGMLQVTRSNIGFYLYIRIHIYLNIITNQTNIYLLLLFTYLLYSFIAKRYNFIKQYYFWSQAKLFCFSKSLGIISITVLNYIKIKFNIVKFRGKTHNKNTEKGTNFDTSKGMNNY